MALQWLFKIPKDHLKGLLASLRPSLNEGVYTMMNKIDRQSPYNILYRLTAWDGMTPNSLMNKSAFDECVRKQAALVNAPQKIAMDSTGAIDWNSFGIYKCLPLLPEGQDPSKWQYKKLIAFDRFEDSLGIRQGGYSQMDLPPLNKTPGALAFGFRVADSAMPSCSIVPLVVCHSRLARHIVEQDTVVQAWLSGICFGLVFPHANCSRVCAASCAQCGPS